jgi:hypothetical protein
MKEVVECKMVKVQRQLTSSKLSIPASLKPDYYKRYVHEDGRIEFIPVEIMEHSVGVNRV